MSVYVCDRTRDRERERERDRRRDRGRQTERQTEGALRGVRMKYTRETPHKVRNRDDERMREEDILQRQES